MPYIRIHDDEWYPVNTIVSPRNGYPAYRLSEETIEEYQEAYNTFYKARRKLDGILATLNPVDYNPKIHRD